MARSLALTASVALFLLVLFLTIRVLFSSGFDILVVMSLGILLLLGVGVIGALTSRGHDE